MPNERVYHMDYVSTLPTIFEPSCNTLIKDLQESKLIQAKVVHKVSKNKVMTVTLVYTHPFPLFFSHVMLIGSLPGEIAEISFQFGTS